ncbi:MAG: tetratricopeptide repeat protein [Methyloceanibacter sp.]
MRCLATCIVVAVMLTGGAVAEPFVDWARAYKAGDYALAFQAARPLAERGDARAQLILGLMYVEGKGVSQDKAEAVKWFRLAAEQGDARAQYNLGNMYAAGKGVPQDYIQARQWLYVSAEQGDVDAQARLGILYFQRL